MRGVIQKRDLHIDLITVENNNNNNSSSNSFSSSDVGEQIDNVEGSSMKSSSSSSSSSAVATTTTTSSTITTIPSSIVNDLDSINVSDNQIFTFDHSRCSDCSYGYIKACDCMSLLNALGKPCYDDTCYDIICMM